MATVLRAQCKSRAECSILPTTFPVQAACPMPLEGALNLSAGQEVLCSGAVLDAHIFRMSVLLTVRLQQTPELRKVFLRVGCPPDALAGRVWLGRRPGRLAIRAGALRLGGRGAMRDALGVQPQPHIGAHLPVRLHVAICPSACPLSYSEALTGHQHLKNFPTWQSSMNRGNKPDVACVAWWPSLCIPEDTQG